MKIFNKEIDNKKLWYRLAEVGGVAAMVYANFGENHDFYLIGLCALVYGDSNVKRIEDEKRISRLEERLDLIKPSYDKPSQ